MSRVRTLVVSGLLALAQAPGLALGQNQPVAITGVTTGVNTATGQRPARLDINTLQNSGPQWDLYILGLLRFQTQAEDDQLSYFQIAGIHGRPYIAWNGVGAVAGGVNRGYCPHNDIQFPAWHRPYLALLEQVLSGHIKTVAAMYTGGNAAAYQAAAATWRTPYWDWAANPALPQAASTPNITVNGPSGQVTVPNPLWSYKWQQYPLNSNWFPTSQDRNLWGWPQTTRQPDSRGNSRINVVNNNLADLARSLKDSIYNVLTRVTDYNTMATTASQGASFEAPHNDVHTTMYAVMAYLDYSAFDPIFMLHHCNVDRYVAMWQAINYNKTFQTVAVATNGQFSTVRGSSVNGDSPLRPFYRDTNGNFHTGRSVASIAPFGYTYPEIDDWSQNKERTRAAVIAAVNRLYGGGLAGSRPAGSSTAPAPPARPGSGGKGKRGFVTREMSPDYQDNKSTYGADGSASSDSPADTKPSYSVQAQVERGELDLPCTIYFYVGSRRAGRMSIPSMPTTGMTYSIFALDRFLQLGDEDAGPGVNGTEYGAGNSTMIDKLQGQLRAEIKQINGSYTPVASAPSLKLQVQESEIAPPPSASQLPQIVSEAYKSEAVRPGDANLSGLHAK
ncbi:hypothetical protein MAPG_04611 [Magnaporthiopsis poae ATCC 64411]|uniref:Tyrosinase copper-binding domain-containing protein n=1 Tax=Magnaporthiopsis poae (strain ATCC 64411 / 73-15) TaxID=644358 RepID=A0A0C4DX73_MAGP6|nr:hypothetical protein MAPG_04611 [Magnaporthiopsis poae ATCC 64411]